MTIAVICQALAAVTSLVALWQMGNRSIAGPLWGLVSQAAWFAMIATNEAWALTPAVIAFTVVHARNLWVVLHPPTPRRKTMKTTRTPRRTIKKLTVHDSRRVRLGNMASDEVLAPKVKKVGATQDAGRVRLGDFTSDYKPDETPVPYLYRRTPRPVEPEAAE